eukprot:Skav200742  [mRNA]  locus=scaffold2465:31585:32931:+ [translate_table: standard]
MGCVPVRPRSASLTQGPLDVLITQSHGLKDASAAALATWMQQRCAQRGLATFYQKGLCGSVKLHGKSRRLLRDAFERCFCVAAAAVSTAAKYVDTAPLANEILWAEQHHKPVLLVYDSSKPIDLHFWEATWPPLFQPVPMVARYYGKGHEACADGFISTLQGVLSKDAAEPAHESPEPQPRPSDAPGGFDVATWEGALDEFRTAQPIDVLPSPEAKGILRRRSESPDRKRVAHKDFQCPQEGLQEAIRYVVKALPEVAAGSDEAIVELLCASVGVSERLVAASLRHLAARIGLGHLCESLHEMQVWFMIALRQHSDSVDVCTFAMQCLDLSAEKISHRQRLFSSSEVECLVSAIRSYPSCQALQRHGFSLLAQMLDKSVTEIQQSSDEMLALPGGGLTRIITRLGVAELALSALLIHSDDPMLFHYVCVLLQRLAPSSKEVKVSAAQH